MVHGTYFRHWNSIKVHGLSRMTRRHIHFAPGLPGEEGVISGIRASCQIYIFVDLKKALAGKVNMKKTPELIINNTKHCFQESISGN